MSAKIPGSDLLSHIKYSHGQKPSNIYKSLATLNLIQLSRLDPVSISNPSLRQQLLVRLLKRTFSELPISMTEDYCQEYRFETPTASHAQLGEFEGPLLQLREASEILLTKGVNCEGIFRLTRSLTRPEELRVQITRGEGPDMSQDDPYDLASLLKSYLLKSLPGMLKEGDIEQIMCSGNCKAFLISLSRERRSFLTLLGRVCRAVDANRAVNKMDLENLARVIAPNMFQHEDPLLELRLIKSTIQVTKIILGSV